jgi:hypothetical protein
MILKLIYILLFVFLVSACKNRQHASLQGDLYFKLIQIPTLYNAADMSLEEYKEMFLDTDDTEQNESLATFVQFLID